MSSWNDFNDAKQVANLIPKGTLCKVRLTIRPGGHDNQSQGWIGGYATLATSGAVYLDCELTVLEGPYAKRKVFTRIGLHSPKGPNWANMGRGLIRSILNSARGISDKDDSTSAQDARRINSFADLDGLEFVARIDVGKDANGDPRNDIRTAVTPDHKEYWALMGGGGPSCSGTPVSGGTPSGGGTPQNGAPSAAATITRPSWAR
jgi:hypothetical protein